MNESRPINAACVDPYDIAEIRDGGGAVAAFSAHERML
jgi:hypothetical protein